MPCRAAHVAEPRAPFASEGTVRVGIRAISHWLWRGGSGGRSSVMRGEASMLAAAGRGHAPNTPAQEPRSPSLRALFSDSAAQKNSDYDIVIDLLHCPGVAP